jgi:hypothetical protein
MSASNCIFRFAVTAAVLKVVLLAPGLASEPKTTVSGPGIIPIGSALTFGGTNAPFDAGAGG